MNIKSGWVAERDKDGNLLYLATLFIFSLWILGVLVYNESHRIANGCSKLFDKIFGFENTKTSTKKGDENED